MNPTVGKRKSFPEILNEFNNLLNQTIPEPILQFWTKNHMLRAWFRGGDINFGNHTQPNWQRLDMQSLIKTCVLLLKAGLVDIYTELRGNYGAKQRNQLNEEIDNQINQVLIKESNTSLSFIVCHAYLNQYRKAQDNLKVTDNKVLKGILTAYPQLFSISLRHGLIGCKEVNLIFHRLLFSKHFSTQHIQYFASELELDEVGFLTDLQKIINKKNVSTCFNMLMLKMPTMAKILFEKCGLWREFSVNEMTNLLMNLSKSNLANDSEVVDLISQGLQDRPSGYLSSLYGVMHKRSDLEENKMLNHVAYLMWIPKKSHYFSLFNTGIDMLDEDCVVNILDACPNFIPEYIREMQFSDERKYQIFEVLLSLDVDQDVLEEFIKVSHFSADQFANYVLSSSNKSKIDCLCNLLISNVLEPVALLLQSECFREFLSGLSVDYLLQVYCDLARSDAVNHHNIFFPLTEWLVDKDKNSISQLLDGVSALTIRSDNPLLLRLKRLLVNKKRVGDQEDLVLYYAAANRQGVTFYHDEKQVPLHATAVDTRPDLTQCHL